ncbi:MAG TPA: hypothetical protein VFO03_13490 [Gaiellaceae bacterium]|nr:hypothetical protein [Gaiellaceae bacterium]
MPLQAANLLDLQRLTPDELDELFRESPAGEIPDGEAEGVVLLAPGTDLQGPLAKLIHFVGWKGKVFDRERGELLNRISPLDLEAVRAKVYKDTSWFDEQETIVLDYSKTSLIAQWIRDEIREVSPGVYLGLVFWERSKLLHFALDFNE